MYGCMCVSVVVVLWLEMMVWVLFGVLCVCGYLCGMDLVLFVCGCFCLFGGVCVCVCVCLWTVAFGSSRIGSKLGRAQGSAKDFSRRGLGPPRAMASSHLHLVDALLLGFALCQTYVWLRRAVQQDGASGSPWS